MSPPRSLKVIFPPNPPLRAKYFNSGNPSCQAADDMGHCNAQYMVDPIGLSRTDPLSVGRDWSRSQRAIGKRITGTRETIIGTLDVGLLGNKIDDVDART